MGIFLLFVYDIFLNNIPLWKIYKMAQEKEKKDYSIFFVLGAIFGALTGYAITDLVLYAILGGIIGSVFASFFVNALVKDRTY